MKLERDVVQMEITKSQLLELLNNKCLICKNKLTTISRNCVDASHEFLIYHDYGNVEHMYINTKQYNATLHFKDESLSIFSTDPTTVIKVDPIEIIKMPFKKLDNKIKTLITFS